MCVCVGGGNGDSTEPDASVLGVGAGTEPNAGVGCGGMAAMNEGGMMGAGDESMVGIIPTAPW